VTLSIFKPAAWAALLHLTGPCIAQTVVATDETLKTQLVEIKGWDMSVGFGAEPDFSVYPYVDFDCGKGVGISATIHSDPTSNGQPYVENLVRLAELPNIRDLRGGSVQTQCYQISPGLSYLAIDFNQVQIEPDVTTYFIAATARNYPNRYASTTARRGWMEFEYYP
jgi:hypothetical protein